MSDTTTTEVRNVKVLEFLTAEARIFNGRHPAIQLQFAEKGDIGDPVVMSIKDAERLLTDLVYALHNHGDDLATRMIDEFFTEA